MHGGVICVLVARRGSAAVRQLVSVEQALGGGTAQCSGQRLGSDGVQYDTQRAALLHTAPHREGHGVMAIEGDLRSGASQQQLHPQHCATGKPHGPHHLEYPWPQHAIIRSHEVQVQDTGLLARLLQPVTGLHMVQDVICNVSAWQEGSLGSVNYGQQGVSHAAGNHPREDAVVTVQQGDGA